MRLPLNTRAIGRHPNRQTYAGKRYLSVIAWVDRRGDAGAAYSCRDVAKSAQAPGFQPAICMGMKSGEIQRRGIQKPESHDWIFPSFLLKHLLGAWREAPLASQIFDLPGRCQFIGCALTTMIISRGALVHPVL